MLRLTTFLLCWLLTSPLIVSGSHSHLPTVLAPFTLTPSLEIFQSPVTKVETISVTPTVTRSSSPGGSAVAVASAGRVVSSVPVVQRIESYSSGDSSNSEIRDLLRSLLSELRSGKQVTTLSTSEPSSSYGGPPPPPSDSYGAPPSESYSAPPSDSYGAPPRNTFRDSGSQSYPESRSKRPEKIVYVQERQQPVTQYVSTPSATAVAQIQNAPVAVNQVVRTVYQPVYVPYQYAPQAEYVSVAQPVTQSVVSAVPTSIKTGVSAVAYSTVHSQPAYAIQQQYSLPVVQQVATLSGSGTTATVLQESSSNDGYQK